MPADRPYLCAVPILTAFTSPRGGFRNCCATHPPVESHAEESFDQWWNGQPLADFRARLQQPNLPGECYRCELAEQAKQHSFRTAVNSQVDQDHLTVGWPSRWNIQFGNLCNLACWTCSEKSSSRIEQHKRSLNLLPVDFVSPDLSFDQRWDDIKQSILKSYLYHDQVELTVLGGEPMYNPRLIDFLAELRTQGLASRTRLEFHTNGTKFTRRIAEILSPHTWHYICIFVSLDSVGKRAEWLRYGCSWSDIETNLARLRAAANYTEVHCTLSILNIMDLEALKIFCQQQDLPLKVFPLATPEHMALNNWDGDPQLILAKIPVRDPDFDVYYRMIGQTARSGSQKAVRDYIHQFDNLRRPLQDFNPDLHAILHENSG